MEVKKSNAYREMYELRYGASYILNDEIRKTSLTARQLDSPDSVKAAIHELTGDENGVKKKGFNRKNSVLALIPEIENRKIKLLERYERAKESAKQQGFEPLKRMPQNMLDEYCRIEATMDVRQQELTCLQELLIYLESQKKTKKVNELMLAYGPEQTCYGEPLQEIDGQQTGFVNGEMTIIDDNSPYQWLRVVDYRRMSNAWLKQREAERDQLRAARNAEIEKTGRSKIILPDVCARLNKKDLPKWPANVKPNRP